MPHLDCVSAAIAPSATTTTTATAYTTATTAVAAAATTTTSAPPLLPSAPDKEKCSVSKGMRRQGSNDEGR